MYCLYSLSLCLEKPPFAGPRLLSSTSLPLVLSNPVKPISLIICCSCAFERDDLHCFVSCPFTDVLDVLQENEERQDNSSIGQLGICARPLFAKM